MTALILKDTFMAKLNEAAEKLELAFGVEDDGQ